MIDICFSGEMRNQIKKYCNFLEEISKEYDVLVFMARKAICFYNALIESDELKISDEVIVTSSRILQYDCSILKGKRVALIDDIIVRGKTLTEAVKAIKKIGVSEYDVYCIASPESLMNKKIKSCNGNKWELTSDEILILGNAITNYITSNSCTYNIDYPSFYLKGEKTELFLEDYLTDKSCNIVPSGTFYNENEMFVQICDSTELINYIESILNYKINNNSLIAKVRFYVNRKQKKIIAVPIIILPELSKEQLSLLFEHFTNEKINKMIGEETEDTYYENILRTIQYILSYIVFEKILETDRKFFVDFHIDINKINYAFPPNYAKEINKCFNDTRKEFNVTKKVVDCNPLVFSKVFSDFFDFIESKHASDTEHKMKYLFTDILDYCSSKINPTFSDVAYVLSIVFDYAIDTGLIVPTNKKNNGHLVRAYRLSEQYELTEKEFDLVLYMYSYFMNLTKTTEMTAMSTQKLTVLFFREVIPSILYNRIVSSNNNVKKAYGITYAKYGPVVSDSNELINVKQESFLTKRLEETQRSSYRKLNVKKPNKNSDESKDKYSIKDSQSLLESELPAHWIAATNSFVERQVRIMNLLEHFKLYDNSNFVKSYDKFLVLLSIGSSQTNQLLALASEVKLFYDMPDFTDIYDFSNKYDEIETGIANGAWKYICFKKQVLDNIIKWIKENNRSETSKYENYKNTISNLKELKDKAIKQKGGVKLQPEEFIDKFIALGEGVYYRDKTKFDSEKIKKELCKFSSREELIKKLEQYYDKIIQTINNQEVKLFESKEMISIDVIKYNPSNDINRTDYCDNKNPEIKAKFDKLMDEMGILLYELMICWQYILKWKLYKKWVKNYDFNNGYTNQIEELFHKNQDFINVKNKYIDFQKEDVLFRIRELKYEAEIILNKVYEITKDETVGFSICNKFTVISRNDNNTIEDKEILQLKSYEDKLTKYMEIEEDNSKVILRNSPQNLIVIDKFIKKNYQGYTVIKYDCNEKWNSILETSKNSYSNGVKELINNLLLDNKDCIISINERD